MKSSNDFDEQKLLDSFKLFVQNNPDFLSSQTSGSFSRKPKSNMTPEDHEDKGFHKVTRRMVEKHLTKSVEKGIITEEEKDLIKRYFKHIRNRNSGLSEVRMKKIAQHLIGWRKFLNLGEYTKCTFDEILDAFEELDYARSQKGAPYKLNTKNDYKTILKGFYQFLIRYNLTDIDPSDISSIKISVKDCQTKTAGDILTEEEIERLIRNSISIRDKAMIYTMYEGGFRACEIGKMRWSQISFDEYGVVINVDEKTKKERYVRLVAAREYLALLKNNYPLEPKGDNYVFLKNNNTPLTYAAMHKQLQTITERAGIEKRVTPHLFRHSRITQMIRNGYSESIIKKMMWGNINTKEFETYLHLCNKDIDNEVFCKNGIIIPDKVEGRRLDAIQCRNCNTINPGTFSVCVKCGMPIDTCTPEVKTCALSIPPELESQILSLIRSHIPEALQKSVYVD